jgi:hypothetical protein
MRREPMVVVGVDALEGRASLSGLVTRPPIAGPAPTAEVTPARPDAPEPGIAIRHVEYLLKAAPT